MKQIQTVVLTFYFSLLYLLLHLLLRRYFDFEQELSKRLKEKEDLHIATINQMQNKHNVLESSLLKHQNDVQVLEKEKEQVLAMKSQQLKEHVELLETLEKENEIVYTETVVENNRRTCKYSKRKRACIAYMESTVD